MVSLTPIQNNQEQHSQYRVSPPSWRAQFGKCVLLTASSVGLGWLVGSILKGSEESDSADANTGQLIRSDQENMKSYSVHSRPGQEGMDAPFQWNEEQLLQSIDDLYLKNVASEQEAPSGLRDVSSSACAFGLSAGSIASAFMVNPTPMAMGALLCLPHAQAESTIKDSVLRQQKMEEMLIGGVKFTHRIIWTAAGAYVGGPLGAIAAETAAQALDNSITQFYKSTLLRAAQRKEVIHLRQERAKNPDFFLNPIESRLRTTSNLLDMMSDRRWVDDEAQMPYVKQFLVETHQILTEQHQANRNFISVLDQVEGNPAVSRMESSHFSEEVKSLDGKYESAAKKVLQLVSRLEGLSQDADFVTKEFQSFAEEVKSGFDEIRRKLGEISLSDSDVKLLHDYLFKEALSISTNGFESSKLILDLKKELHTLNAKGDKAGALNKAVELKKAIQQEGEKREDQEKFLRGCEGGFQLVGLIASASGSPKLGYQVSTFGQSVTTIARSINELSRIGWTSLTITSAVSILGPIGAIGAAISSIFQLFTNSGPSDAEEMFHIMQNLSKILNDTRYEMHQRFDRIENIIQESHNITAVRFDRLEEMFQQHHGSMHKRFDDLFSITHEHYKQMFTLLWEVRGDSNAIRRLISEYARQQDSIEAKIDAGFRAIYQRPYSELRVDVLQYHRSFPNDKMPREKQIEYYLHLLRWAKDGVMNPLVTKSALSLDDPSDLAKAIVAQGMDANIQSLAEKAHYGLGLSTLDTLPHPVFWAEAVDTYLEFIMRTPEFKVESQHLKDMKSILAPGRRVQEFVSELQTTPKLYITLLDQYRTCCAQLQEEVKKIIFDVLESNESSVTEEDIKGVVKDHLPSTLYNRTDAALATLEVLVEKSANVSQFVGNMDDSVRAAVKNMLDLIARAIILDGDLRKLNKEVGEKRTRFNGKTYETDLAWCALDLYTDWSLRKASGDKTVYFWPREEPDGPNCQRSRKKLKGKSIEYDLKYFENIGKLISSINAQLLMYDAVQENGFKPLDQIHFSSEMLHRAWSDLKHELTESHKQLQYLLKKMQKNIEKERSDEGKYAKVHEILRVLAEIDPKIVRTDQIETRILSAIENLPEKEDLYLYLLHHLTPEEGQSIRKVLLQEFQKAGSPLQITMEKLQTSHVFLEAFVRLGFEQEFGSEYDFRELFENIWTARKFQSSVMEWDTERRETIPYIQIQDAGMESLDRFQNALLEKLTDKILLKEEGKPVSGNLLVDLTLSKLEIFRAIMTEPAECEETRLKEDEL